MYWGIALLIGFLFWIGNNIWSNENSIICLLSEASPKELRLNTGALEKHNGKFLRITDKSVFTGCVKSYFHSTEKTNVQLKQLAVIVNGDLYKHVKWSQQGSKKEELNVSARIKPDQLAIFEKWSPDGWLSQKISYPDNKSMYIEEFCENGMFSSTEKLANQKLLVTFYSCKEKPYDSISYDFPEKYMFDNAYFNSNPFSRTGIEFLSDKP